MKLLKQPMGYRGEIKSLIVFVAFLSLVIFLVVKYAVELGICKSVLVTQHGTRIPEQCLFSLEGVGGPIFLLSLAILLTLIPLFFTKEAVYRTWKKFTLWFIPVALFLIFLTPETTGGGFGPNYDIDRSMAALILSGLYIFISFLIMIGVFDRSNVKKQA